MLRYWEAETTPGEERELSHYVASTTDPEFDEIRGVMGYLSIGREREAKRVRTIRAYSFATVVACAVLVAIIGLNIRDARLMQEKDICVSYYYGKKINDDGAIMNSVESSLSDFFGKSAN